MVMSSVRTSLLWSVEIRKVWRELFYHLEVKTCFLYHSFSYNAHAVSHQRHTRKIVRILEPVMSADKYLSIFSRQMEAIFYTCVRRWGSKEKKKQEVKLKKLKKRLISNVRQSFTSLKEVPKTLSVYLHNDNNGIFRYRFVLAFHFKNVIYNNPSIVCSSAHWLHEPSVFLCQALQVCVGRKKMEVCLIEKSLFNKKTNLILLFLEFTCK